MSASKKVEQDAQPLHTLADYQLRARNVLTDAARHLAWRLERNDPKHHAEIRRTEGVSLLHAPTGSGKTLVLGRAIEALVGDGALGRTVWFWFAPYSGLVRQTRDALRTQSPGLRLRDIGTDRESALARDGDVYVTTWASVAASNKDARVARRGDERTMGLDDMIADLRSRGFQIGAVIDEAHTNFGQSAKVAAGFYLDVLDPDITWLATATPNDTKLDAFESAAGVRVAARAVIERHSVVTAKLNKAGLTIGVVRAADADLAVIDLEQATLHVAWLKHQAVKARLAERGIGVTPLMLVQVEDDTKGSAPVDRVQAKLAEFGVPPGAMRTHTANQPDEAFHTIAYDPTVEVLIFKVAVATGFDAPRAWTLASVRPNRDKNFGLQIVGRIMRVHPSVRAAGGDDPLLDRGYVFLTDPEAQAGLEAAAAELKAVREGFHALTDDLDVVEYGNPPAARKLDWRPPTADLDDDELQGRLNTVIGMGLLKPTIRNQSRDGQARALAYAEDVAVARVAQGLWGDLPNQMAPTLAGSGKSPPAPHHVRYELCADLDVPSRFWREMPPSLDTLNSDGFVAEIAETFIAKSDAFRALTAQNRKVDVGLREVFLSAPLARRETVNVLMSPARVAQAAQEAFRFNPHIDSPDLQRAMLKALAAFCDREGVNVPDKRELVAAMHRAVQAEPQTLKDALRIVQARHTRVTEGADIPPYLGPPGLDVAEKGAHGVFYEDMNAGERRMAEFLDQAENVRWWIRAMHSSDWAPILLRPSGKRFFPDFAVGVAGRRKRDEIALIEVKEGGEGGRRNAPDNLEKMRVEHKEYGNVRWAVPHGDMLAELVYDRDLNGAKTAGRFKADLLSLTN